MINVIRKFLQKIFKIASYFFFLKIYGKIETSIESNSDERIKVESININKDLNYKIYKINSGRLYTDRIHDTAAILENKIIKGPSFQLRDNNNSDITKNSVFEKGTPRKLKNLNGSVLSLLTGGGGNNNYWHWLYDVLPRLELCKKVKKLDEVDFFLFPNLEKKFQIESLKILNLPSHKLLSSKKFRHVQTKQLIVTNHPYIQSNNSHEDAQKIPEWISKWLKEKFLSNINSIQDSSPKKIYIDRTDSKSNSAKFRSIINEDEVKNFLVKKDFTLVRLEELSFDKQVYYFNNAEFVIGLHGAGFANLSFCRENTKVIEFRMNETGKVIENLAKINNLKFDSITSKALSHNYAKQLGHIEIPLNLLERKIYDI